MLLGYGEGPFKDELLTRRPRIERDVWFDRLLKDVDVHHQLADLLLQLRVLFDQQLLLVAGIAA